MKILQKNDLNKVAPKFRKMVVEAWNKGEDVPWGVTLLSDKPLSSKELNLVQTRFNK
jgi:hypothetical protein